MTQGTGLARRWQWSLIAVVIVGSGLLAGGEALAQEDRPTRVTWLVGLNAQPQQAPRERRQQINGVVKAFNQSHPRLRLRATIETGDVVDRLSTMIARGEAPDVVGPTGMRLLDTNAGGWLDLGPLVESAGSDLGVFDSALLELYRDSDGALIGLPFAVFPSMTYYNRELFDQAGLEYPPASVDGSYTMPDGTELPWDFDTLRQVSMLLTVDANGNDATSPDFDPTNVAQFGFNFQYGEIRRDMATLVGAAPLYAPDDEGGGTITIPDTWLDGLTWLQDARFTTHFMPNGSDLASLRFSTNPFALGKVAMAVAPLWYTCCITDLNGTPVSGWDLGVVPIGLNGERTSPLNADTMGIIRTSKNPEAAFQVLQYLLNDEGARGLYPAAPSRFMADREEMVAFYNQQFPDVRNWSVAGSMLDVADSPNNQAYIPNFGASSARLNEFYNLLQTDAGATVDMEVELDRLAQELQVLVDEAAARPQ
jgi:multiple sugar transport system substrate-binding protein